MKLHTLFLFELYKLEDDIAEAHDVAGEHPELVAKFERLMREQHVPSAEFPMPALDNL
jgi:hypothetical protein